MSRHIEHCLSKQLTAHLLTLGVHCSNNFRMIVSETSYAASTTDGVDELSSIVQRYMNAGGGDSNWWRPLRTM